MLIPLRFVCPVCASENESAVDPSQGRSQRYVEDCQVCCRPLVLRIGVEQGGEAWADAEPESA